MEKEEEYQVNSLVYEMGDKADDHRLMTTKKYDVVKAAFEQHYVGKQRDFRKSTV